MLPRSKAAVALLVAVVALAPQAIWAGVHAVVENGRPPELDSGDHHAAKLADALLHGHEHPEGTPDHEHHLAPESLARLAAPRALAGGGSTPEQRATEPIPSPLAKAVHRSPPRVARAGSPLLHTLGVLLI